MDSMEYEPLSQEETARLKPLYHNFFKKGQSFIRTIPGSATVPLAFEKFQKRIKNWTVRPDDVYVLGFPKSGTTWTQELVWLIQNDCNFEEAEAVLLDKRVPFLDVPIITDSIKDEMPPHLQIDYLKSVEEMPSPRLMKCHFRFCLLPEDLFEKSKVVICLRNPKDTVVSFYHHEKLIKLNGYIGNFPAYFGLFMDNLVHYCPFFEYVKEAWQLRNHPNVCLVFYENMKKDLANSVRRVATFLGKNITDDIVEALVDHLSFAKMKNNADVNKDEHVLKGSFNKEGNFIPKGEIRDWKNYFTDEMNKRMDEEIEKHFKPIGLEFQYE